MWPNFICRSLQRVHKGTTFQLHGHPLRPYDFVKLWWQGRKGLHIFLAASDLLMLINAVCTRTLNEDTNSMYGPKFHFLNWDGTVHWETLNWSKQCVVFYGAMAEDTEDECKVQEKFRSGILSWDFTVYWLCRHVQLSMGDTAYGFMKGQQPFIIKCYSQSQINVLQCMNSLIGTQALVAAKPLLVAQN
jgi:hypothetical protein